MPITAQRLLILEPQKIGYHPVDLPDVGEEEVLIKNSLSGISHGTEMMAFLGKSPFIQKAFLGPERLFSPYPESDPPFYPFWYCGYDSVGIVEKAGTKANGVKIGDRVWHSHPHQTRVIRNIKDELFVLPESVKSEEAIVLNLTAIAFGAVLDAQIKLQDKVIIVGAGAVGILAAQLALINGAGTVYLIDVSRERLAKVAALSPRIIPVHPDDGVLAKQVFSKNAGEPPDVVIECSGSPAGLHAAIQCAGINGTVIAVGFYASPARALNLSEEFLHNRITIKASMTVWGCMSRSAERWSRPRILREALDLIAHGLIDYSLFTGNNYPFTEAQQAYDNIEKEPGKYLKTTLSYQD